MADRYAIIESGGRQIKVAEGETVRLQKLPGQAGAKVSFGKVLLVAHDGEFKLGLPHVKGAKVEGEIVGIGKEKKVIVAKFKRRKKVRRSRGHRQLFTEVKVLKIRLEDKTKQAAEA